MGELRSDAFSKPVRAFVAGWSLTQGRRVPVGPYFGDDICYRPGETLSTRTYDCIPTIASQIAATNAGGTTTVAEGVSVSGSNSSGIAAALALVEAADVVVMAIGIDHTIEQ